MFRFIVRKYAGVAVDLGCCIPKPPCLVLIDAIKTACSGSVLLLVSASIICVIIALKSEHKSLSHVFQFLG